MDLGQEVRTFVTELLQKLFLDFCLNCGKNYEVIVIEKENESDRVRQGDEVEIKLSEKNGIMERRLH